MIIISIQWFHLILINSQYFHTIKNTSIILMSNGLRVIPQILMDGGILENPQVSQWATMPSKAVWIHTHERAMDGLAAARAIGGSETAQRKTRRRSSRQWSVWCKQHPREPLYGTPSSIIFFVCCVLGVPEPEDFIHNKILATLLCPPGGAYQRQVWQYALVQGLCLGECIWGGYDRPSYQAWCRF